MITCPYCQATTRQNKAGKTEAGLQRYRCRHCDGKYFLESRHPTELAAETFAGAESLQPVPSDLLEASQTEGFDLMNVQVIDPAVPVPSTEDKTVQPPTAAPDHAQVETLPTVQFPSVESRAIQTLEPVYAGIESESAPQVGPAFPIGGSGRSLSKGAESAATSNRWGWLPEIALLESFGLLILAWGFVEARVATQSAELFLWVALAVMILPVVIRLASTEPSRRERIALVLLLGMTLYLTKVMHSPIAFTFPDELSHLRNVHEVLETHRLFQENPVQPVTAFYPGLPAVTGTLSSLSGLSVFSTGLLVIGTARLILFLALYLLFEQVSGTARVASLATVLYMANPNFLYWTAEYAYEPLALPLLVFVLLMVVKREMSKTSTRPAAWTVAAVFGVLTVVITHHMSSYILTGLLGAVTVLFLIHSRGKQRGPWLLTLVSLFVTAMWLIFVANFTIDYLSPVLSGAIKAVFQMIAEEETSRELFTSSKGPTESSSTPLWEQLVALGSVVVIVLGLPLGAFEIWKRHRNKVFALLLGTIALSYLPVQMLRFTSAGWETANRSSEFLFIGIGFVLALGIVKFWLSNWAGGISKMILGGLSVALFFGGLIAGWPPRARLSRPYVIDTGEHLVRPQIVTVSEWMLAQLGPDNRIAASKADAKMLGAYGQYPFTGNGPIRDMFQADEFGRPQRKTLLKRDIQYVVSDRKNVSWDHMIGYYFYSRYSNRASDLRLVEPGILGKFEGLEGVTRMLDSGDIVIYDVTMHLAAYKESMESGTLESTPTAALQTPSNASLTPGSPIDGGAASNPSQASLVAAVPDPGCMWYTVEPSHMRIDLTASGPTTSDESGQMHCLHWIAR